VIPIVLGFNVKMVKPVELPKSYEDLLHPRWKSNMFFDDEAYEWSAVLQKHWGRDKAVQYMRALAKQDLRMLRGRTQQSQLLARHAPHPHAAALFYDWALPEEGQSMITTFGRVVARKGVKQRFPELVQKESFLVDTDFIGPIMDQTGKEFRRSF